MRDLHFKNQIEHKIDEDLQKDYLIKQVKTKKEMHPLQLKSNQLQYRIIILLKQLLSLILS